MIGLTFPLLPPLNGIRQDTSDIEPLSNPLWVRASFPQILGVPTLPFGAAQLSHICPFESAWPRSDPACGNFSRRSNLA